MRYGRQEYFLATTNFVWRARNLAAQDSQACAHYSRVPVVMILLFKKMYRAAEGDVTHFYFFNFEIFFFCSLPLPPPAFTLSLWSFEWFG